MLEGEVGGPQNFSVEPGAEHQDKGWKSSSQLSPFQRS